MDYEKKYKEAIERAKAIYYQGSYKLDTAATIAETLQNIFPELAESEGEKTKRLLHTIANKISQHLRDIFTEEEFQCFDAWSNAWLEKQGEQKSSWSEEDEMQLDAAIHLVSSTGHIETTNWLKSIKERVQPQSEWSEEDEKHLSWLIEHFNQSGELYSNLIDWLKSLKYRYTWKPSDEQMGALEVAVDGTCIQETLYSLYQDLEKLK